MKTYLPRTWVDPSLYSAPSNIHGTGVFTHRPIKKNEIVMIWGGVLINRDEYDDTWEKYRNLSVVQVDEEHFLGLPIEDTTVSLDEYLNHSCDPNTWLIDEVTVVARKDIAVSEEITMDCALWNDDDSEEYSDDDMCACGTSYCRKKLTAHDWKVPAIQKKYKGHFSPYLEKRINAMHK